MQLQTLHNTRVLAGSRGLWHRVAPAPKPKVPARDQRCTAASTNGSSAPAPTPAETARTMVHLCNEGMLSTITSAGMPLGTPVAYTLDASGQPVMHVVQDSAESHNLQRQPSCSLLVQPIAYPARRVAAVALQGTAKQVEDSSEGSGLTSYALEVVSCVYCGGLDSSNSGASISGDEFRAAEPDTLRDHAMDLINTWNSERAEDMYRIVGHHLGVPLSSMQYAELLWLDRLGMYIRSEVAGREPQVVRVPFYRPVLDERDVRSVITMAAQIAWEKGLSSAPAGAPR